MDILTRQKARFGSFELDSQTGELFKEDERINLHGQPIEILSLLLDHPGELVPREVIRHRLWPKDTFVDFEHSLNTAIKKLRQTLDDNPDAPRYIETLPKKGYRFIAPVEMVASAEDSVAESTKTTSVLPSESNASQSTPARQLWPPKPRRWLWLAAALVILVGALMCFLSLLNVQKWNGTGPLVSCMGCDRFRWPPKPYSLTVQRLTVSPGPPP